MAKVHLALALGLYLTTLAGCEQQEVLSEDKGFIANNDSGNNYLLAFLGDSNGIPGTLQDIPAIARTFNSANGLNFTMPGPYNGGWQYPSNQQILSEVSKAAKAMLDKDLAAWKNLQRGGTLFIYFTSHGSEDGTTSTGGGSSGIQFSEIARAIRSARGEHPVERLVVMFDTCFSGTNITGSKAINQNTGTGLGLADVAAKNDDAAIKSFIDAAVADANSVKGFYKSAIFIGSSLPTETSGDEGGGGTGTQAFLKAIAAAKGGALISQPGRDNTGSGTLGDLLSSLGGGSNNNTSSDESGFELTDTATAPASTTSASGNGAGTGRGPSSTTIKQVLENMVSNAFGQTPVWCVEPRELADDFFFDPPEGYLPQNPVNAAKTGANNRVCSR